ncbi:MAG: hypothetical protein IPN79_17375 [Saprospiraceae bacterium]|nr:hypothetical protein [Saprospiraceae bacterium]
MKSESGLGRAQKAKDKPSETSSGDANTISDPVPCNGSRNVGINHFWTCTLN